MRRAVLALAIVLMSSCATQQSLLSPRRFVNQPPVWKINDREPIEAPAKKGMPKNRYFFDRYVFSPLWRAMNAPDPKRARNVNSLGEVPDSTWFENRIGVRDMTAAEVGRGPNVDEGPDSSAPWVITGTKIGGASVGFLMKDARGLRYILKFDQKGFPETETAADVIVQRLLWAAGFHVPEDSIVYFKRDQLTLAPDAKIEDTFGNKRPMTAEDLENKLALVNAGDDGRYRGMASKFLDGKPLGGVSPLGVRKDDANDIIKHQHRRDLRGQYVIFSWLSHTDVKADNTLDMLVTDPVDPNHQYVMHYLVDFGKALGAMGYINRRPEDGYTYNFDVQYLIASLFGLGLWQRPWDGIRSPGLLGVGRFESKRFDPKAFRALYPWEPFDNTDRFDAYWGAKIVARFSDDHIRAAVDAGQLSDPRSRDYLVKALMVRRDKIVRYYFTKVSPLERFAVQGERLCFDDLWQRHQVRSTRDVMSVRAYDQSGAPLTVATTLAAPRSHRYCTAALPTGDYVIVRIVPYRSGEPFHAVEVHVGNPGGVRQVIGIVRR